MRTKWLAIGGVLLLAILTFGAIGWAATINVPTDWPDINIACMMAGDGDTVNVSASGGPYLGPVVIMQPNIIVQSTDGAIIEGGVQIYESGVTLSGFTIQNAIAPANILLTGGASGCTIENNIVRNNAQAGIGLLLSDNNIIRNNTIYDTGAGIALIGSSTNTIQGNDSSSNGYGIAIDNNNEYADPPDRFSTSNTIDTNTLSNNALDGIYLGEGCDSNTLSNNTVSGSGGDGIYFWKSSSNTVTGNTSTGNTSNGIHLMGSSSNTITDNIVTNNTGNGFYIRCGVLSSTGNTMTGNDITGNGNDGLLLIGDPRPTPYDGIVSGNAISFNNIFDNGNFGMRTQDTPVGVVFDAEDNWWGDVSGPYNATLNPSGLGNAASDNVDFDPWTGMGTGVAISDNFEAYRTYPIDPATGAPYEPEVPDCTGYPDEPAAIAAGWEFDAGDANPWMLVDECDLWGMTGDYPNLIPFASTIQAAYVGYLDPDTGTVSYAGIESDDPILRSPMVALDNECVIVETSWDYWREVEFYSDGSFDQTWVELAFYETKTSSLPLRSVALDRQIWFKDSTVASAAEWLSASYTEENIPVGAEFAQLSFHFEAIDDYNNDYIGWFIDNVQLDCFAGIQEICWSPDTPTMLPQGYIYEEPVKYTYPLAQHVTPQGQTPLRFYLGVGTEESDCDCDYGDCRILNARDPYPLPERLTLSPEGVLYGTITPEMEGNYTFWVMVETSGLRDGNCACYEFHLVIRAESGSSGAIYEYSKPDDPGTWTLCGETDNPSINLWNQTDLIAGAGVIVNSDGQQSPSETVLYFGQPTTTQDYDTGKRVKGCYCIDLSSYLPEESAGSEVELGFKHWRDVEEYSDAGYDKTWVEMSTNGILWTQVTVADGTVAVYHDLYWDSRDASVDLWLWEQGTTGVLIPEDEQLWLRFCFDSVDGYTNDPLGWLISEIAVWVNEPTLELDNCGELPTGYVGEPYDVQIKYAGGTPVTNSGLTVTGLPDGLELDKVSNKIVGVPRRSGEFPIIITVPDVDEEQCTLVISEQRCFFHEDFEDDPIWVWTGLWTRVGPAPNSVQFNGDEPCPIDELEPDLLTNNVAYYGDAQDMDYETFDRTTGLLSLLDMPAGLDVTGVAYIELSFDSCRQVEQFSAGYDQTKVQVRFDTANTWHTVWYKDSSHENSTEWTREQANHETAFAVPEGATTMWVRFVFDSVDKYYNGYFGWMIDNIWICNADVGEPIAPESSYMSNTGLRRSSADELSVTNFPNPVEDVHTTTFTVRGVGVEAIRIQIFDQNETLVFEQQVEGQELEWHTENNYGEYLANGTYYYRAYARIDGEWIPTKFEKVVILR